MSVGSRLRAAMKTPPMRFQIQGVRCLERNNGRALLLDDMGLGKTYQTIGWLALHPEIRPVLIVCPATVKHGWKRELKKHAGIRAEVLEGRTPYRPKADVVILNYEIAQYWLHYITERFRPKVAIFDECHYIKTRGTKRTKAAHVISENCNHVIGLSGTPITNAPVEFFPILQMVRPDLFNNFWAYAFRYCDPKKGFRGKWDFRGASHLKGLRKKIEPFVIRRLKRDVLKQLPKKRRIVIPVDITNKARYKRARDDFMTWLTQEAGMAAAKKARAAVALVRMAKLKQLVAEGKITPAIQWINDWLESNPQKKLVVFVVHKVMAEALRRKYPTAALVTGAVPNSKRHAEVKKFQKNPKCRVFIGQIKSAGTGLDGLQEASSATLTLELGWNDAIHNQADDRVLRIGQMAQSVENYYMVGNGTIEEWLLEVIHDKQTVVDDILEGTSSVRQKSLYEKMLKIV